MLNHINSIDFIDYFNIIVIIVKSFSYSLKSKLLLQFMLIQKTNFYLITGIILLLFSKNIKGQSGAIYPKVTSYVGILHPIITFNKNQTTTNFTNSYVVGLPTGINFWKSNNIGFSIEFIPFIKAENNNSKMYNLLFHPGILVRLNPNITFAGRIAFETIGRYGLTPIFNKVLKRNKNSNYYTAIAFPLRTGNNLPSSLGIALQFGLGF